MDANIIAEAPSAASRIMEKRRPATESARISSMVDTEATGSSRSMEDGGANRRCEWPGVMETADQQSHVWDRLLPVGLVDLHGLLGIQPVLVDVADDTDDGAPWGALSAHANLTSDGVFFRPQAARRRLVDEGDLRPIAIVRFFEQPAAHQGDGHGSKITRAYFVSVGRGTGSGREDASGNRKVGAVEVRSLREDTHHAGGGHSGKLANSFE